MQVHQVPTRPADLSRFDRLEALRIQAFRVYESVRAAQRAQSSPDRTATSLMDAQCLVHDLAADLASAVGALDPRSADMNVASA